MKLLIAPDSFKGSLSAEEVCEIISQSARECLENVECLCLPVADGGEGMVNAMLAAKGGELVSLTVQDPLGRPVQAGYAKLPDGSAAVEMAAASGLPLLAKEERDPVHSTTYGAGQLIRHALEGGCRRVVLGLGGSATNDGGLGVGAALGMRFLDGEGNELPPCGESLSQVERVDLSGLLEQWRETEFVLACDVENPLCGERGAANIYGPQKGADRDMIAALDRGLHHFASLLERRSGRKLLDMAGMGAAGGMALPFMAFGNARLQAGLDIVLDAQGFDGLLEGCDLVVTGEGRTDAQSAMGKVASGVGRRAEKAGVPAVILSGALEDGCERLYNKGITAMFASCSRAGSVEWHMDHARENLSFAARQLFRLIGRFAGK